MKSQEMKDTLERYYDIAKIQYCMKSGSGH